MFQTLNKIILLFFERKFIVKNIWIIAPFAGISREKYRNRFQYLAKKLTNNEFEVTLITSDFSHTKKEKIKKENMQQYPFKIKIIKEFGYQKNVSIKRALSHIYFSLNLKKKIGVMKKPDLICAAYPTMSAAYIAGKYAVKNNIPFILDIQDIWPESISSALDTDKFIVRTLMWPFAKFADHIYRKADLVFGVSETYAQRANVKNSKSHDFIPVYIGTDLNVFDSVDVDNFNIKKNRDDIWITYIGTLSYSYDIATAVKTFSKLKNKKLKLNILGTGPDQEKLKNLAKELEVYNKNVFFYGYLEYEKMVAFLKKSDLALNAIKGKAKQTITNKLGDYVSAGLAILNSCQEKEVLELVEDKKLGVNYKPGDPRSLKEAIIEMLNDKEKLSSYGKNSRQFAEKYFDRKNSYQIIINEINKLLHN